jgi:hypothetical protein
MKDDKDKREGQRPVSARNPKENPKENPKTDPKQDPRADRLKLALRENLKRRKSQARGRHDAGSPPSGDAGACLDDKGEKKPNG